MPVLPTSYEALLAAAVVDAVALSATFIAAGGGANRVIFVDGGKMRDSAEQLTASDGSSFYPTAVAIFCHVGYEPYEFTAENLGAPQQFDRTAAIPCALFIRRDSALNPRDNMVRALNIAGAIRQEVETSAALNRPLAISGNTQMEQIPDGNDALGDYFMVKITFNTGAYP